MRVVKSISFTDEYRGELNHFMAQPNKSRYICDLIKRDIDKYIPLNKTDFDVYLENKFNVTMVNPTVNVTVNDDEIEVDGLSEFLFQ